MEREQRGDKHQTPRLALPQNKKYVGNVVNHDSMQLSTFCNDGFHLLPEHQLD